MDWGKLLQGVGGKLLRQLLGTAMREGVKRMGGTHAQGKAPQDRAKAAKSRETQKRLQQVMRIGRRFWK